MQTSVLVKICVVYIGAITVAGSFVINQYEKLTIVRKAGVTNRLSCGKQCSMNPTCNGFILRDSCELILDLDPRAVCATVPGEECYGNKAWEPETTIPTTEMTTHITTEVTTEAPCGDTQVIMTSRDANHIRNAVKMLLLHIYVVVPVACLLTTGGAGEHAYKLSIKIRK